MKYSKVIISAFLLTTLSLSAQKISEIKIGVNGLTCSACTRSVEMSLLRLDFVDSVAMSLENTEGIVYTKELMPLDFNKIAKAVTNAGFSVRFLEANIALDNLSINDNGCFSFSGLNFQWIGYNKSKKKQRFAFVDAPFLPNKEYSKWKKKIREDCSSEQPAFHIVNAD